MKLGTHVVRNMNTIGCLCNIYVRLKFQNCARYKFGRDQGAGEREDVCNEANAEVEVKPSGIWSGVNSTRKAQSGKILQGQKNEIIKIKP